MSKQLLVSSAIQAALMNEFLMNEIQNGFWVNQRPIGHGAAWDDVEVIVTETNEVGPAGDFKPSRFYDFLNPEFTKIHEARLVQIAQSNKSTMTFKALKKELIELARIIGGRMTDKTQEPARVYRGNNRNDFDVIRTVERQKVKTAAGIKIAGEPASTVKKTVVKKQTTTAIHVADQLVNALSKKTVKKSEPGVTITTTSTGATVRRVAAVIAETV